MSKAYTGGCACGAIHYKVSAEQVVMNDCQCRDCQRRSGTGHGSYLTFVDADVNLEGDAKHWDVAGESGNMKSHGFCPTCGITQVYLTFAGMPNLFTVHAASLDDPGLYQPQPVTYRIRGHTWDHSRSGPARILTRCRRRKTARAGVTP